MQQLTTQKLICQSKYTLSMLKVFAKCFWRVYVLLKFLAVGI